MISEESCAVRLGLTRVMVASMRREHLYEGVDWERLGRRVMITDSGQEKLLGVIGIKGELEKIYEHDSLRNGSHEVTICEGAAPSTTGGQSKVIVRDGGVSEDGGSNPPGAHLPNPEEATLIVSSPRPPRNSHIIEALLPSDPKSPSQMVVRVRVRDNKNFMPGMEIRARRDEAYPDVYVLVGRTPRYRGRW